MWYLCIISCLIFFHLSKLLEWGSKCVLTCTLPSFFCDLVILCSNYMCVCVCVCVLYIYIQTKLVEVMDSSWVISNPKRWCCESAEVNMPANLENSAVATGLEKVSFHSNTKEGQRQRMFKLPHNWTHLTP